MTLYITGLGLFDEKDISVKGLEIIKECDEIYLENYTAVLNIPKEKLEQFYGKEIILADRTMIEQNFSEFINKAKEKKIALLIVGDVLSATTHAEILLECKKKNIDVKITHNASIFTAVAETGLQLYKFGKTTSIPFFEDNFKPETFYDVLKQNKENELHTLILLDLRPREDKFMTVNEAIKTLLKIEEKRKESVFTNETMCIGCARLGGDSTIKYGKTSDLIDFDFGKPMHSLILPGKLHFSEEDMLENFK